jgi:hypothetical protein
MNSDVTVVTAYFDLGTFRKGHSGTYFTRDMYHNWARIFRHVKNPMVIFTDSEFFKLHITAIRNESLMSTKIVLLDRSSSWAFQNIDKIKKIFESSTYPKHYPNTVVPAYACAQHAKYDMIERAAKMNAFSTAYYMWIDIGYFRNRKSENNFYLTKPPSFDDTKIAFNLINSKLKFDRSPATIMKQNLVLLGGGLFFGKRDYVIKFAAQFEDAVDFFISQGLSNTDQQVIYAMFSKTGRKYLKPEVELQVYTPPRDNDWFYLGTIMIQE